MRPSSQPAWPAPHFATVIFRRHKSNARTPQWPQQPVSSTRLSNRLRQKRQIKPRRNLHIRSPIRMPGRTQVTTPRSKSERTKRCVRSSGSIAWKGRKQRKPTRYKMQAKQPIKTIAMNHHRMLLLSLAAVLLLAMNSPLVISMAQMKTPNYIIDKAIRPIRPDNKILTLFSGSFALILESQISGRKAFTRTKYAITYRAARARSRKSRKPNCQPSAAARGTGRRGCGCSNKCATRCGWAITRSIRSAATLTGSRALTEEARQVIVGMSGTPQSVVKLEMCRSSGAWLNSEAAPAIDKALLPELLAPSAAWGC